MSTECVILSNFSSDRVFTHTSTACACSKIGSLGQSCDRVTGQCNCKTSVTGRNCTLCEVIILFFSDLQWMSTFSTNLTSSLLTRQTNTFNFGPTGCEDCRCNSFGSVSLQCNSSGQCPCQANATGLKCTQCASGFYGLPEGPCGGTAQVHKSITVGIFSLQTQAWKTLLSTSNEINRG